MDYGVQLWNPDLQAATSPTTSDSYDYDRIPLGPFIEIGSFLSLSTDPFISDKEEPPPPQHQQQQQPQQQQSPQEASVCYELLTLSRPCIHEVVKCLLEKNQQEEAVVLLQYCYDRYHDFVTLGELLVGGGGCLWFVVCGVLL